MKWLQGTQGRAPNGITEQRLGQSLQKRGNGHTGPAGGLDPAPQAPKGLRFIRGEPAQSFWSLIRR